MPTTLCTKVRHIYDRVPNSINSKIIEDFHSYMKDNATSDRHQNNNLKAITAFAKFLGSETTFYQISTKDQVTEFLDTKIRSDSDPERRWITTWNDYLVRIKHFFRWLHSHETKSANEEENDLSSSLADWYTPAFVKIKTKRTKRLSPYQKNEICDIEGELIKQV